MKDSTDVSLLSHEATGIYESVKVYHGVCFRLEEHLERFWESAKTLGFKVPLTRPELRRRIEKELADSGKKEAFVRLTLAGNEIFVVVGERMHPPEMYQRGVSLKTGVVRRNSSHTAFPEAKSTCCLNQVLASLDPTPAQTYEILFLNEEGYLAEVRIGNIFLVKAGVLLTPPPRGLLNGVTRRFVIECARSGKIPVEERPLMRHELFNAEEAFLTNTTWEVLPVREVDGRRIGEKLPGPLAAKPQVLVPSCSPGAFAPGPVTQRLRLLFQQGVRREIGKVRHGKS